MNNTIYARWSDVRQKWLSSNEPKVLIGYAYFAEYGYTVKYVNGIAISFTKDSG